MNIKNLYRMQARIIAGLAHPKRLEIVQLLSQEPLSVQKLTEMTGIAQANVSQHLMLLRKLGLVNVSSHRQLRIYSLSNPHVAKIGSEARSVLLARTGISVDDQLSTVRVFIDPICGMEVTAHTAASHLSYEGKHYYFCAKGCEKQFQKKIDTQRISQEKGL